MSANKHVVCPHCHRTNRVAEARLGENPKCGVCQQPLFDAKPLNLDQSSFASHIRNSDLPVLVDFWAPWCGPCKMMAPVFNQAAAQLSPQVRLAKVNTEEQGALAAQYAIRSIPTLALFRSGQEVARSAGAMDLQSLIQWTRSHI